MTLAVRAVGLALAELGYDIGESLDSRLPVDCVDIEGCVECDLPDLDSVECVKCEYGLTCEFEDRLPRPDMGRRNEKG